MSPPGKQDGGDPAGQPEAPAVAEPLSSPHTTAKKVQEPLFQLMACEPTAVLPRRVRRAPTAATERAQWYNLALRKVAERAAAGGTFTAHDLATECEVPEPPDFHMWGQLMGLARAAGLVVAVAAVPSSRPKTAKSLCRLWTGAKCAQTGGAA